MARAAPDPPGRRRLAARHRAHGGGRVAWVQGQRRALGLVAALDRASASLAWRTKSPRGRVARLCLAAWLARCCGVSLPALQRRSHKPPGP